ncbi:hypothetical protein F5X71_12590 [Nocardia brasiliensis]|uniref:Uncharacterized protein n=1 Tax=Nocardia brasiliensis TaxID=37326 RepID=A0A6G9XQ56_NOCBR|nr:hypothetical protein [Nocardia brasiliensis]QIS03039.1 hypothetical protein F5X71_12590 [Nocardia brasiliensis]
MRSNGAYEEQLSALEGALTGLRGLDVARGSEEELADLLDRLEAAARMLAGMIARVAYRLRQLREPI